MRKTIELSKYFCGKCKRILFVKLYDRSGLDTNFGCPFGCGEVKFEGFYIGELKKDKGIKE